MAGVTPAGPVAGASGGTLPAVALVAAGGTLGVLVRALLVQALPTPPGAWPWTTFAINLVGSFVLGALLAFLTRDGGVADQGVRRRVRLGVGTGVLGGFTTYSTFALEVEQLVAGGHAGAGVAYALVSVVVGVAAAGAGLALGGRGRRGGSDARGGRVDPGLPGGDVDPVRPGAPGTRR